MSMFNDPSLQYRARRFGDNISTDYIIASSRKKETINTEKLKHYLFEDIEPGFFSTVESNDVIVAGSNFGCGSAMEIAVTVLLAAGIKIVIAESFARTFLRNAFNNGLVPLTAGTKSLEEGELLKLTGLNTGKAIVHTEGGRDLQCDAIPPFMLDVLATGGLVPYLKVRQRFVV